jgi:hypothetical protein
MLILGKNIIISDLEKFPANLIMKLLFVIFLFAMYSARSLVPCSPQFFCPDMSTCCFGARGWGCCPGIASVCCADGFSCCPRGTICDLSIRQCRIKDLFVIGESTSMQPALKMKI